jgi:hypothetical protein
MIRTCVLVVLLAVMGYCACAGSVADAPCSAARQTRVDLRAAREFIPGMAALRAVAARPGVVSLHPAGAVHDA